jgi:hypothetical protein
MGFIKTGFTGFIKTGFTTFIDIVNKEHLLEWSQGSPQNY